MVKRNSKPEMKEAHQQQQQEDTDNGKMRRISKSRDTLSHYDSHQTLAMGSEPDFTPGDSTFAFPCSDECRAQGRQHQQNSAHEPNHKHKCSAPPTGPSSTTELLPPSSPFRTAPAWLLRLDRHWNHVVPLWVALSLLCLLVLVVAVPTQPLEPAKVVAPGVQMGHLLADGCTSACQVTSADAHADDMVPIEFNGTLPPNVTCWITALSDTVTVTTATATTNVTAITRAIDAAAQSAPRPMDLRPLHDEAQAHKRALPREQLCPLLVALTLFRLPLPAYVLVGGCCWVRLSLSRREI